MARQVPATMRPDEIMAERVSLPSEHIILEGVRRVIGSSNLSRPQGHIPKSHTVPTGLSERSVLCCSQYSRVLPNKSLEDDAGCSLSLVWSFSVGILFFISRRSLHPARLNSIVQRLFYIEPFYYSGDSLSLILHGCPDVLATLYDSLC